MEIFNKFLEIWTLFAIAAFMIQVMIIHFYGIDKYIQSQNYTEEEMKIYKNDIFIGKYTRRVKPALYIAMLVSSTVSGPYAFGCAIRIYWKIIRG